MSMSPAASPKPGSHARFTIGDRVLHAAKPEWGTGTVVSAAASEHEGIPCQRLSVRFTRGGLKTISTAFADIQPAAQTAQVLKPKAEAHHDPLPIDSADRRQLLTIMTAIPEPARDPFASPAQRLKATLALYRFGPGGGELIDWAAAQCGLADPLSRFNRHELEEYYRMFEKNLHTHLSKVVRDANNVPADELVQIAKSAPPGARRALQKLHRTR